MSGRRTETMERDAQIYRLHKQSVPHDVIAKRYGITSATVGAAVRRAIQDTFRLSADEERAVVQDQIDELMFQLRRILIQKTYLIGVNGKVAIDPRNGEPLLDYAHVRATIELIRKFMEMKTRLLGLNQPVRHRVEITDKMDEEIERIASELALHGAGEKVPAEPALMTMSDDGRGTADDE